MMAAPEAPLRYVRIPRESTACRLMKQRVGNKEKVLGRISKTSKDIRKGEEQTGHCWCWRGVGKPNLWAFDTTQSEQLVHSYSSNDLEGILQSYEAVSRG